MTQAVLLALPAPVDVAHAQVLNISMTTNVWTHVLPTLRSQLPMSVFLVMLTVLHVKPQPIRAQRVILTNSCTPVGALPPAHLV